MSIRKIEKYREEYEEELLALLKKEPDWNTYTNEQSLEVFKSTLLNSETYICKGDSCICGYIRAIVDTFGVYISELYVAPNFRKNGYGKALLAKVKSQYLGQEVYVLSDEDLYYENLGYKHVGSVFQL